LSRIEEREALERCLYGFSRVAIKKREVLELCLYGFSGVAEVAKDMREKPEVLSAVQKVVDLAEDSLVTERDYIRKIRNFVSIVSLKEKRKLLFIERIVFG
jgi:hypothetical protein